MTVLFWLAVWFLAAIVVSVGVGLVCRYMGRGDGLSADDAFYVAPEHTKL